MWEGTCMTEYTNELYYNIQFLQLQHQNSNMFQPFLVSHHLGVYINIFIKHTL